MVKPLLLVMFLSVMTPALGGANLECPAPALLPQLDANYHECHRGFQNGSCDKFVDLFRRLLPRSDCQRSFDTGPVPALWLADSAAMEDYVHLLSRLNTPKAKALFGSAAFREILNGALAEEYVPLSLKAQPTGAADTCTQKQGFIAEAAVDGLNTWEKVARGRAQFSNCDDGGVAEGFSDAVARLFAHHWADIPALVSLIHTQPGLEPFVLAHLNESDDYDDLKAIRVLASHQCPATAASRCVKLVKRIDSLDLSGP
jgi:hypothetical protein